MEPPADEDKGNKDRLESIRTSKKLSLAIVFLALMIDNVLLSVVGKYTSNFGINCSYCVLLSKK